MLLCNVFRRDFYMKGNKKRQNAETALNTRGFIISTVLSMLTALALLLIFSIISYRAQNPSSYIRPFGYTVLALSSFITGYISSKAQKHMHLISGLIGGFIIVALMFVSSLFFSDGTEISALASVGIYALYILISGLGGIFGGVKRVKGKRRHR